MKFYIRRAVAGIILMPVVAFAYVVVCAFLIGAGAGASFTVAEAWTNGLLLAGISAVSFTFYPQIDRLLDKVVGK